MAKSDSRRTDVRLRNVEDDDLEIFFEQQSDPEANRIAAFPARDREAFFTHWKSKVLSDPSATVRTVVADGHIAGSIVCWEESRKHMIGYWYGRDFWGSGIATRALIVFLNLIQVRPLYANPVAGNTGSIRVLEKGGFRRFPALDIQTTTLGEEVTYLMFRLE